MSIGYCRIRLFIRHSIRCPIFVQPLFLVICLPKASFATLFFVSPNPFHFHDKNNAHKKDFLLWFITSFKFTVYTQNLTITPNGITPAMGGTLLRLSYEGILALPSPPLGDLAYDLTYNYLRVYNGKWKRTNAEDDLFFVKTQ